MALSPAAMIATISATAAVGAAFASARVPPVGHPRVLEVIKNDLVAALTPPTASAAGAVDKLDEQVGPTEASAKAGAGAATASVASAAGAVQEAAKAPPSTPPYKSDDLEALFLGGAF
jgi:hypothetical protein